MSHSPQCIWKDYERLTSFSDFVGAPVEVIAPLGGLRRRHSYQEPFNIEVYLNFEDAFLTPTAVYDLPLSTGTDLKCPSLLSALWLLLCRLMQRDYEGAAKLLPFCASAAGTAGTDALRQDEERAFRMALSDTSDRAPDAVAAPCNATKKQERNEKEMFFFCSIFVYICLYLFMFPFLIALWIYNTVQQPCFMMSSHANGTH